MCGMEQVNCIRQETQLVVDVPSVEYTGEHLGNSFLGSLLFFTPL